MFYAKPSSNLSLSVKLELFGNEFVAIDSTKFKASNSGNRIKTKNNQKKVSHTSTNRSISIWNSQINPILLIIRQMFLLRKNNYNKNLLSCVQHKKRLEQATEELTQNNQKHISLTDPDCRLLKHGGHIESAYSLQTAVDVKHSLARLNRYGDMAHYCSIV